MAGVLSRLFGPKTIRSMAAEFGPPPAVQYPELLEYSDYDLIRRPRDELLAEIRRERARKALVAAQQKEASMRWRGSQARRRIEYTHVVVEEEGDLAAAPVIYGYAGRPAIELGPSWHDDPVYVDQLDPVGRQLGA